VRVGHVRPSFAIHGLFILFGVVIAAFFPFFTLFLKERGMTPEQIGFVIAAMAFARIVMNPVWGHLADTRFGRRAVLQFGTVAAAVSALVLFAAGEEVVALVATSALFAAVGGAIGPNIDAMALVHLGDSEMHAYGGIRAWESLSYAVATLLLGFALTETGVEWTLPIYAAASLTVLAWSFTLDRDPPQPSAGHGRMGAAGAVLRSSSRFRKYLASMFFVWVAFSAAWNFIALRIADQGGNPRLVGLGLALGGTAEVPMMLLFSRAARRFGLRAVYVAGACVYAAGFLIWGLISSPLLISLASVFEGLGFGLLFASGVVIVGKLVPMSLYSSGQAIAGTVAFGIAPIVGGQLGGYLYGAFGSVTLYVVASGLAFAGGLFAYRSLATPSLTRPAPVPEVEPTIEPQPGVVP